MVEYLQRRLAVWIEGLWFQNSRARSMSQLKPRHMPYLLACLPQSLAPGHFALHHSPLTGKSCHQDKTFGPCKDTPSKKNICDGGRVG